MAYGKLEKASEQMPHNIKAERAVLGCILQDNSVIDEVFASISYYMFYDLLHQVVFASIGELKGSKFGIDEITVQNQAGATAKALSKNERFVSRDALTMTNKANMIRADAKKREGIDETSLSDDFFVELLEEAALPTNVMSYCAIIRETYVLRETIKKAREIIVQCQSREMAADMICNLAQDDFYKLSVSSNDNGFVRASDLIGEVFDDLEKASKSVNGITGIRTGYTELDNKTGGLQRTDMIVLAGRPGKGKTTFALNLASKICDNNYTVAFFSLEMTSKQLVKKVLADSSGTSLIDMRSGRIGDEGMRSLLEASRKLSNKNLYIYDNSFLTIAELRNLCQKRKKSKEGLDAVFIDYLQLMHAGSNYRNSDNSKNGFASRQEEIAEISRNIKGLAKDLDVPIIALSQVNRDVENRKSGSLQLSDIRESGAIEQDADIVLFLNDPDKEGVDNGIILSFAKHRNGSTGDIGFRFDKATSSFNEWDYNGTKNANV